MKLFFAIVVVVVSKEVFFCMIKGKKYVVVGYLPREGPTNTLSPRLISKAPKISSFKIEKKKTTSELISRPRKNENENKNKNIKKI